MSKQMIVLVTCGKVWVGGHMIGSWRKPPLEGVIVVGLFLFLSVSFNVCVSRL